MLVMEHLVAREGFRVDVRELDCGEVVWECKCSHSRNSRKNLGGMAYATRSSHWTVA